MNDEAIGQLREAMTDIDISAYTAAKWRIAKAIAIIEAQPAPAGLAQAPALTNGLLPCPFCGNSKVEAMDNLDWVCCQDCGASLEDAEPSSRALWNTRAALPQSAQAPAVTNAKLGDPHPHWSASAKNENYPKTAEEWDPHKDPVGEHLDRAMKRLRLSIDRDDPRAPEEMALVSRWDLTTLIHDWWHKCAVFDIWRAERAEKKAAMHGEPQAPAPTKEGGK